MGRTSHPPVDLNLTWLLQQLDEQEQSSAVHCTFSIDRSKAKTPSRNAEIEESQTFHRRLGGWVAPIKSHFQTHIQPIVTSEKSTDDPVPTKRIFSGQNADSLLIPVQPLLEEQEEGKGSVMYIDSFLMHTTRSWTSF